MSTRRYSRNATILIKKEATEQVDPTPNGSLNAYKVRNLSISPIEGKEAPLEYIQGYYGGSETLRVESYATCEFEIDFAGFPGDSAGTAAPWEDALLGCAFTQKALMATAVTGTSQAGGSATTIKLAAGASAVDDYYNGMLISLTSGTYTGATGVIIDYVGSTKIATVHKSFGGIPDAHGYSIAKATVYELLTTNPGSVAIYYYLDGDLHILLGARGNVSFDLSAGGVPTMKFNFIGVDASITTASLPATVMTMWGTPSPLLTSNVIGYVGGKEMSGGSTGIQAETFSLDMGNQIEFRQVLGASGVILSGRDPKGQVRIEATPLSFKNWFNDIKNLTKSAAFIRNGNAAGNYCTLFMPKTQLTGGKYGESSGIVTQEFGLNALPVSGNDEVRIVVQ